MYYSISGGMNTQSYTGQVPNKWNNFSISTIRTELGQTGSINFGGTKLGVLLKGGAAATDNTITNVSLESGLRGKGTNWVYPTAGNSYTVLAPNDLLSYATHGRYGYVIGNDGSSNNYLTYGYQSGQTALNYIGLNSDPNNLLYENADSWYNRPGLNQYSRALEQYYVPANQQSKLPLKIYQIPAGCTSITIQAWGGGGGAGGSWFDSYGGYGGAGGYAQTTLVVNSTINPATGRTVKVGDLLYCWVGLGGGGSYDLWHGGMGGMGSAVWLLHGPTFGAIGYPEEAGKGVYIGSEYWTVYREWVGKHTIVGDFTGGGWQTNLGFEDCLGGNAGFSFSYLGTALTANPKNLCVLVAGGGGGGSAINWSGGLQGPSGGSGGSDGAGGVFSGSGTGATVNGHGQGLVTPNTNGANPYSGCEAAGVYPYQPGYTTRNGSLDTPEASMAALFPNSVEASNAPAVSLTYYAVGGGGGGGAFKGQVGPTLYYSNSSSTISRGGGGGANKVYLGTNQSTAAQGVTSSPYNSDGTHGVGGSPRYVQNPTNYWRGAPGRAGKIILTFNA